MDLIFTQSARKHRIGKTRAVFVIETVQPVRVHGDSDDPDRLIWIGPDNRGLILEIEALVLPDCILVIHVMPHRFRRGK